MRPQHAAEKFRRHFIVLLVGLVGKQGYISAAQCLDKRVAVRCSGGRISGMNFMQTLAHQVADTGAQHGIGQQAALTQTDRLTR